MPEEPLYDRRPKEAALPRTPEGPTPERLESKGEAGEREERKERKEGEAWKETVEITDADGNPVCKLHASYERQPMPELLSEVPMEVEAVTVVTELNVEGTDGESFDLFEFIGKRPDALVTIAEEGESNYFSTEKGTFIRSPRLETPLDISVLLHELGHSNQMLEEHFQELNDMKRFAKTDRGLQSKSLSSEAWLDFLEIADYLKEHSSYDAGLDPDESRRISELIETVHYQESLPEHRLNNIEKKAILLREMLESHPLAEMNADEAFDRLVKETSEAEERHRNSWFFKERRLKADKNQARKTFDQAFSNAGTDLSEWKINVGGKTFSTAEAPERTERAIRYMLPQVQEAMKSGRDLTLQEVTRKNGGLSAELRLMIADDDYLDFTVDLQEAPEIMEALPQLAEAQREIMISERDMSPEREALKKEAQETLSKKPEGFEDVLRLPVRLLERDATKRALKWMHKMRREKGVDLLVMTKTTELGRKALESDCESDTVRGLAEEARETGRINVADFLEASLASYGASLEKMGMSYQKDIEKIRRKAEERAAEQEYRDAA